jgi:hypothetical protein
MGSATESLQGMYVKGGSFLKNSEEYVFDKIHSQNKKGPESAEIFP